MTNIQQLAAGGGRWLRRLPDDRRISVMGGTFAQLAQRRHQVTDDHAVVDASRIRCTHHDAFRFFTPPARPLNAVQPTREDQLAMEQPGCLHATMDLYKWAYKLTPAVPSELVADCFELARQTRELDMRAAPYDLSSLGYAAIPIETGAGRAEYVTRQCEISDRGQELGTRLLPVGMWVSSVPRPAPRGVKSVDAMSTLLVTAGISSGLSSLVSGEGRPG